MFMKKELFFYEIPLPLEIKKHQYQPHEKTFGLPRIRSRSVKS